MTTLVIILIVSGFAYWFFKKKHQQKVPHIKGDQIYSFRPTATSSFQENLEKICGGKTEDGHDKDVIAVFIPHQNNPDDPNAVKIMIKNMQIGEVIHHITKEYRQALTARGLSDQTVSFDAKIVGGWYEGYFGVKVDLPNDFLEAFSKAKTLRERLNEQQ